MIFVLVLGTNLLTHFITVVLIHRKLREAGILPIFMAYCAGKLHEATINASVSKSYAEEFKRLNSQNPKLISIRENKDDE